ncbi:MAG: hypothetical protein OEV22_19870, partial [Deltaproteobacteria bacterium]|nr:hypothetical protein [Deltaproteobacteria bacterium]
PRFAGTLKRSSFPHINHFLSLVLYILSDQLELSSIRVLSGLNPYLFNLCVAGGNLCPMLFPTSSWLLTTCPELVEGLTT